MKVGFAVQNNEGIESRVYNHFGSAPTFIIVDTEGKEVLTVNNKDLHHVHGACNPVMALDGKGRCNGCGGNRRRGIDEVECIRDQGLRGRGSDCKGGPCSTQ